MARAALRIGVQEVAAAVEVNPNTGRRIENGKDALASTIAALRAFYEANGIIFIAQNGAPPEFRYTPRSTA